MPADPYVKNLGRENFYAHKSAIHGRLVVVLRGRVPDRALEIIPQRSRVVLAGEVHELIATDERGAGPGRTINSIAYLGFVEFSNGGVLLAGDELRVGGRPIGHLAGYDYTHMPNHMNIIVAVDTLGSGEELGLALDAPVVVTLPGQGTAR
jgi:hypothetical protein